MEVYLAEEAIGLAKSLEWDVHKGPFWREEYDSRILHLDSAAPIADGENEKKRQEQEKEEEPFYKSQSKRNRKANGEDVRPPLEEGWAYAGDSNLRDG